jgi:hypothetical protein
VLQLRQDVVEDYACIPYVVHLFHEDVNPWQGRGCLLDFAFLDQDSMNHDSLVDVLISCGKALVEGQRHKISSVDNQCIEHQEYRLTLAFAPWLVVDELSVEQVADNAFIALSVLLLVKLRHVEGRQDLPEGK